LHALHLEGKPMDLPTSPEEYAARRARYRAEKSDRDSQVGHEQVGHKQVGHKQEGHKQEGHKQEGHKQEGHDADEIPDA